jgi:hypothetical protein
MPRRQSAALAGYRHLSVPTRTATGPLESGV